MFTIKLHKNILCIFVHDISQYLMKCCTSMSDITQLIFSLHHYLTAQASSVVPGQGALPSQNSLFLLAALLAMPTLLCLLLSDHSAQLLRVAVADGALRSRMLLPSHFIEYLTTALVRLYFAGTPAKTRGTMLCWHFSLASDLP